jgi:hypothetical protein
MIPFASVDEGLMIKSNGRWSKYVLIALSVAIAVATRTSSSLGCDSSLVSCPPDFVKSRDPAKAEAAPPPALTFLGLTLNRDHIADAMRVLGRVQVIAGDGECGGDSICYQSPDNRVAVSFDAWPDGGVLRSFSIQETASPRANCAKSAQITSETGSGIGLKLGMRVAEAERILGKPSERRPSVLAYSYQTRRHMTDSEIRDFEETYPRKVILKNPFWWRWSIVSVGISSAKVSCFTVIDTETW